MPAHGFSAEKTLCALFIPKVPHRVRTRTVLFVQQVSSVPLPGTPSPNKKKNFLSPRDEDERRKILKMLVTPAGSSSTGSQDAPPGHGGNHGSPGGVGAIAAARERRRSSAANFDSLIIKAARSAEALNNPGGEGGGGGSGSALSPSPSGAEFFRKESSLSLQIPGTGGISPSASLGNKKVTFSQVVDQVKYRKKVIFLF